MNFNKPKNFKKDHRNKMRIFTTKKDIDNEVNAIQVVNLIIKQNPIDL